MKPGGSPAEVFRAFLVLGVTSFGGPIAHLGYFRSAFVDRHAWLSEADYAGLVSLCQFLPGPASSQTGFCIGLIRAGWLGGLAAWAGFTLPSALLMFGIAAAAAWFAASPIAQSILHGLQLAAVAVVAQAVWSMARSLCPDLVRRGLAAGSAVLLLILHGPAGQILVLILGGLAGRVFLVVKQPAASGIAATISHSAAVCCLTGFALLLGMSFLPATGYLAAFDAFYRAGALVFGGGHVVLPLLQTAVVGPGWVSPKLFLAGYGAAQAMPGPLFTVAAFLGAVSRDGGGVAGAIVALLAIFLPGLLLVTGALPFWHRLQANERITSVLAGVNAAVVGLLLYAWLDLVRLGALRGPLDLLIAGVAFLALTWRKVPPLVAVVFCVVCTLLQS